MNGMNSFCQGDADWHRLEAAQKYGRPINSFVVMTTDEMISMGHADLAIYCSKLQKIIASIPGVDLTPHK